MCWFIIGRGPFGLGGLHRSGISSKTTGWGQAMGMIEDEKNANQHPNENNEEEGGGAEE